MPSAPEEGRAPSSWPRSGRRAAELTPSEGGRPARRRAAALDHVLAELVGTVPSPCSSVAVVAVGGYGRGDVSPHSDVDLLVLVDDKRRPSPEDLRSLLYPPWMPASRWATPSARPRRRSSGPGRPGGGDQLPEVWLVAGPAGLMDESDRPAPALAGAGWPPAGPAAARGDRRAAPAGRAGRLRRPDQAGRRRAEADLHAGRLAGRGSPAGPARRAARAGAGREPLLAVREALHGQTRRKNDRAGRPPAGRGQGLGLDGDDGADRLEAAVHTSARTVEYLAAVETSTTSGCSAARAAPAWSAASSRAASGWRTGCWSGRNRRGAPVRQLPMQGPLLGG